MLVLKLTLQLKLTFDVDVEFGVDLIDVGAKVVGVEVDVDCWR